MPHIIETIDEWYDRHGGVDKRIKDTGGNELMPDGAKIINSGGLWRQEPPEDKLELKRAKAYYQKVKVDRLCAEYRKVHHGETERANMAMKSSSAVPPSREWLEWLKEQAKVIEAEKAELEERKAELEEIDPVVRQRREQAKYEAERRADLDQLRRELMDLPAYAPSNSQ